VEGDIDFFKELKNISTASVGASVDASVGASVGASAPSPSPCEQKRCLLTDDVLRPDAVTLKCGHSFNYVPLYKEVLFQKCSTLPKNISSKIMALYTKMVNPNNGYSSSFQNVQAMTYNSSINLETTKLHYDEIKCPYCRAVTPNLLPYYPYPEVTQVKYVNSPSGLCLKGVSCEYYKLYPEKNHKSSKKNQVAATADTDKKCDSCPTYTEQYGILCRTHLKKVSSSSVSVTATKTKKTKSENSIVSHIDPTTLQTEAIYETDTSKCGFLLLTGPRKGQPCGCNATTTTATATTTTTTTSLCKRHLNK
jgi:hypothetical protein